jgi:hypothetical protein
MTHMIVHLVDSSTVNEFMNMAFINNTVPIMIIKGNYVKEFINSNNIQMNLLTTIMILSITYGKNEC